LVKGLEEDHTLATEAASEENEDGTRLKRCARLVWAKSLAGLRNSMLVSALFRAMQLPVFPLPSTHFLRS
jgi:hypothetical protein